MYCKCVISLSSPLGMCCSWKPLLMTVAVFSTKSLETRYYSEGTGIDKATSIYIELSHLFKLDIVWFAIFFVIRRKVSMTLNSAVLLLKGKEGEREKLSLSVHESYITIKPLSIKCTYCISTYHFIGNHDDEMDSLLPNHLPKVGTGVFERALGHDVAILPSTYCEL